MSDITVFGAGAFGTALAISLAQDGRNISLIPRSDAHAKSMENSRENTARLPGFKFPETLRLSADPSRPSDICLMAVPTQALSSALVLHQKYLEGRNIVACCKGVDLQSGLGPTGVISQHIPSARPAILSGPSFAIDIAAGLPTALTIAANVGAEALQKTLSTTNLRLYRTRDVIGVELGGALKNVIAIGAGITIGAGLGESARAALITRGLTELINFAQRRGAKYETLMGLSGFGDLILTSTSEKSRNYSHGLALGAGKNIDTSLTIEGVTTARAIVTLANKMGIDMPITSAISALVDQKISVSTAMEQLLSRPLKEE